MWYFTSYEPIIMVVCNDVNINFSFILPIDNFSPTAEQRMDMQHITQQYIVIDGAKRIAAATEAGVLEMAAVIVTCPGSHPLVASKVQKVINRISKQTSNIATFQLCAICSTANDFVSNWRFSERCSFFCTFLEDT
jgi:hypothetical protein